MVKRESSFVRYGFAQYHDELKMCMSKYAGQTLQTKQIKKIFKQSYPKLRDDFVQPSDHCINPTCKGACCHCSMSNAIFEKICYAKYRVL